MGITAVEVVIDVAGQRLTFPREKVSAIYFAAPPRSAAAAGDPLRDALRLLKGLQSATTAGINYRDYAPRVTDAKIQVDRLLTDVTDSPTKTTLVEAMEFYVYASNAWSARIARSNYHSVGSNPLFDKCDRLKHKVAEFDTGRRTHNLPQSEFRGITISISGVEPLFGCASERVETAERLLRGQ